MAAVYAATTGRRRLLNTGERDKKKNTDVKCKLGERVGKGGRKSFHFQASSISSSFFSPSQTLYEAGRQQRNGITLHYNASMQPAIYEERRKEKISTSILVMNG